MKSKYGTMFAVTVTLGHSRPFARGTDGLKDTSEQLKFNTSIRLLGKDNFLATVCGCGHGTTTISPMIFIKISFFFVFLDDG